MRSIKRAASLTNAVLSATEHTPAPWLVWVHYPDAHAPYIGARVEDQALSPAERYAQELSYVDLHVGRLIADLAARARACARR